MNHTDAAYLAGMIDGEGSLTVSLTRPKTHRPNWNSILQVKLCIYNTDKRLIDWLLATCGGCLLTRRPVRGRPVYQWQANTRDVPEILAQVRPYLKLKGAQADLLVEVCQLRVTHGFGRKNGVPAENLARRAAIVEEVRHLNARWQPV